MVFLICYHYSKHAGNWILFPLERRTFMKSMSFLQFGGNEVTISNIEQQVKKIWSSSGNLLKDIKELRLYVKPEENMVYYVINDVFSGNLSLLD
jgi:hypothetical protein